jgi:hypothetical protein
MAPEHQKDFFSTVPALIQFAKTAFMLSEIEKLLKLFQLCSQ